VEHAAIPQGATALGSAPPDFRTLSKKTTLEVV